MVGWLVVYLLIYQCDVRVPFPVVAAASTYCTYSYLYYEFSYLLSFYFASTLHILLFIFPSWISFYLPFFPIFSIMAIPDCPIFPNQPTNPPSWALGFACLWLPLRPHELVPLTYPGCLPTSPCAPHRAPIDRSAKTPTPSVPSANTGQPSGH